MEEINQPIHYSGKEFPVREIKCDDIARFMPFNLGNAFKYVWRAGLKSGNPAEKDFKKALWYLDNVDPHKYPDYQIAVAIFDLIDPIKSNHTKYNILSRIVRADICAAEEQIKEILSNIQ